MTRRTRDIQIDSPTDYVGPTRRVRELTVRNVGTTTVPMFGLVEWYPLDTFYNGPAGRAMDGQWVGDVRQPVAFDPGPEGSLVDGAVGRGSPCLFAVNVGPPIPPQGYGRVSQDWPLQVLHEPVQNGRLGTGQICGPRDGFYSIGPTGEGFRCLGVDPTQPLTDYPVQYAANPGTNLTYTDTAQSVRQTVWVVADPGVSTVSYGAGATTGEQTVEVGDDFQIQSPNITGSPVRFTSGENKNWSMLSDGKGMLLRPGVWLVSFSATVGFVDSAPNKQGLAVILYMDDLPLKYRAARTVNFDTDQYGNVLSRSVENVAFTALLDVPTTDPTTIASSIYDVAGGPLTPIYFRNDSGYDIEASYVIASAVRIVDPTLAKDQESSLS